MKNYILLIIIIMITGINFGCKEDKIVVNRGGNSESDTSILRTDEFGNILGGDLTDWCFLSPGGLSFGPAYPNPASVTVNIKFTLVQTDTLAIFFKYPSGPDSVLVQGAYLPGYYDLQINAVNFKNTYRKLCISSKRYLPGPGCSFCGDIRFE